MLKRIFLSLVLIVAILVTVPIIYVYSLSNEEIKQSISDFLSNKTHHQIILKGDIQWRILPYNEFIVNDIVINPNNKNNHLTGRVSQLTLKVNTWDLLHQKLNFKQIKLNQANLTLTSPGTFLTRKQSTKNNTANKTSTRSKKLTIAFNNISIQNSAITINTGKNMFSLNNLSLALKRGEKDNNFRLQGNIFIKHDKRIVKGQEFILYGNIANIYIYLNRPDKFQLLLMDAKLIGKQFNIEPLIMKKIDAKLTINNGVIKVKKYGFNLSQGKVSGQLEYDTNHDILSIKQRLDGVDAKKIIDDLNYNVNLPVGKLNMNWQSTTHPVNQNFLYHTQSTGKLVYKNTLFNLHHISDKIEPLFQKPTQSVNQQNSHKHNQKYKFSLSPQKIRPNFHPSRKNTLTATFRMNEGIVNPINFKITSPSIKANGELKVNLFDKSVAGHMKLITSSTDKKLKNLQNMLKDGIPLTIKGRIPNVGAYPDMTIITPILINHFVKETGKAAIQNLGIDYLIKYNTQ